MVRKTAHKILVSHFEGQADVGYVTLLAVILTTMRNGQKALKDLQVRNLGVLVPLTVQIHRQVEEQGIHQIGVPINVRIVVVDITCSTSTTIVKDK